MTLNPACRQVFRTEHDAKTDETRVYYDLVCEEHGRQASRRVDDLDDCSPELEQLDILREQHFQMWHRS